MYVLDLDLDFFLDNICPLAEKGTRPDANQASPWPEEQVRFFLEHNCGLRRETPVPGALFETHDQALSHWQGLEKPLSVTHVDAHSDLGVGKPGPAFVLESVITRPVEARLDIPGYYAQQQLDEAQTRWRKAPRDAEASAAWEGCLYAAVQTDLYDEDTRRRLPARYCALSDRLLRAPRPAEDFVHHRIQVELQQKRYARAQQLCTRYLTLYPESELAVRDEITVCVHTKNGAALQAFLGTLRSRPVLLTPQTLAWVRAFRKEEFCEQRS